MNYIISFDRPAIASPVIILGEFSRDKQPFDIHFDSVNNGIIMDSLPVPSQLSFYKRELYLIQGHPEFEDDYEIPFVSQSLSPEVICAAAYLQLSRDQIIGACIKKMRAISFYAKYGEIPIHERGIRHLLHFAWNACLSMQATVKNKFPKALKGLPNQQDSEAFKFLVDWLTSAYYGEAPWPGE